MSCAARRVETPSPDSPADLETFRTHTSRPVHVPRDFSLSVVLLPDRGNTRHGRAGTQLAAGPLQVCISPSEPSRTDTVQDQGGRGADPARGAILAHSDLVPAAPPWQIPLRKDLLRDGAPCGTHVQTSGNFMSGPLKGRGGSRWTSLRGSRQHHFGGSAVYETFMPLNGTWSSNGALLTEKTPRSARSESCCPSCSKCWSEGCLPPPSKSTQAAIAANHVPVEGKSGGEAWLGHQVPYGGQVESFTPLPSIPSWDLSLVLTALQQGLFEPLQTVEPKFQRKSKILLLLALASIKRVGDLHAFRLTIRA